MDAETKRDIEDIKITIKNLENEEAELLKDLERVRKYKADAMDRLKALSNDEKYQADMLAMVYEQRQKQQKSHE